RRTSPRAGGKMGTAPVQGAVVSSWPQALRRVRGWLDPWTFLWRCWRAGATAPPPSELQALLDGVADRRAPDLYPRCSQSNGRSRSEFTPNANAMSCAVNGCRHATSRRVAADRRSSCAHRAAVRWSHGRAMAAQWRDEGMAAARPGPR